MMDEDIPKFLRRDKNNVAPFMRRPDCTCGLMTGECRRAGCPVRELDVPEYVDDAIDQCPIKVNPEPLRGDVRLKKEYPAGTLRSEITEFEVWDGNRWISDGEQFNVNPEASLPASDPNWVPPWASKS